MVSGDTSAKLGGILAIVALMNADVCNTGTRISRCVIFSLGSSPDLRIQSYLDLWIFGSKLIQILGSNPDLGIHFRSWDPILILGFNLDLGIQSRSSDKIQSLFLDPI